MTGRGLTEAACHFGGVVRGSTVTRTCRATGETVLVPPRTRRSQVGRITGTPGKSAEDETAAARLVVATKRSNARGAKEPCCTDVGVNTEGRGGLINPPSTLQDLRRRLCVTAKAAHGLITRDVNGAGARSAANPHAACDAAGTGNGITVTSTRARKGKPGHSQGAAYGLPRQFPTLPPIPAPRRSSAFKHQL